MRISLCDIERPAKWRVTWRAAGKTGRRYFRSRKAAEDFSKSVEEEIKDFGELWTTIPAKDRAELAQAWKMAHDRGYSVIQACQHFEAHGERTESGISVEELCSRFMTVKIAKGLRPESIRLLETTLDQFKAGRESTRASNISAQDISEWMAGQMKWGPWRRRGVIIDLRGLFSWAVSAGLLVRNPVEGVERPIIEYKTPEVLTVQRARALLKLCRERFPKLLAWLAIGLFAGLRSAELERLRWEDVGEAHIELASHQTKGRARRLVAIRPVLAEWLALCRKKNGPVCPFANHQAQSDLKKAFGGLPRNVLRHSFISYELATSKDVQALALEAGNSPDIIFKHYRQIVTPEQGEKYWELFP